MLKLYIGILLALTWALLLVSHAGGKEEPVIACYQNPIQSTPTTIREMVLGMIKDAGFDPVIADRVVNCESGWNPDAKGDGGKSWGLWQIHQPAHNLGSASFDPYLSTVYAIKLLESSRSWSHWTCYNR